MLRYVLISTFNNSKLTAKQNISNAIFHTYINTANITLSTHFYRDGIGLSVLSSFNTTGDYKFLLGATSDDISEVFLGDPEAGNTNGVLDLVYFPGQKQGPPQPDHPKTGFLLITFWRDINSTLSRLSSLGLGGVPKIRTETENNITLAVVRDPDGQQVILLESTV
jgi:catechol 2,3-dioxygenase-like lactoylglutathione lyase family enzyme